ncbi:MAG: glpA [Gammaproteobacteria bacterium]|nr:glpA [Gammaproteobacteria bacterium]
MLVLTRNIAETIVIDKASPIKVTVLSIHKNQVRLGVEAPSCISVHREEIFKRILQEEQKIKKFKQRQGL